MAVALVATASAFTNGSVTLNITIPASAQVGHTAILFVDNQVNNATVSVPGWTQIGDAVGTPNIECNYYQRVLVAGDPGSTVTITCDLGTVRIVAQMLVYSGVDTTTPVPSHQNTVNSTATYTSPALTYAATGMVVVHIAQRGQPVGTNWTMTGSPALTERLETASTSGGVDVRSATGDVAVSGSGTYAAATHTSATSNPSHFAGVTLILDEGTPASTTLFDENFDGLSQGEDITTSNTAFTTIAGSGAATTFEGEAATFKAGTSSARVNVSATNRYGSKTWSATNKLACRIYIRPTSLSSNMILFNLEATGSADVCFLVVNSDRTLKIQDNTGLIIGTSTSQALPVGQWSRLELMVNAATVTMRAYIGSVDADKPLGQHTVERSGAHGVGSTPQVTTVLAGAVASTTADVYIDELLIMDQADGVGPVANPTEPGMTKYVRVSGVWTPATKYLRSGGAWV